MSRMAQAASRPPGLLRTVLNSFPSHGSSLHKAPVKRPVWSSWKMSSSFILILRLFRRCFRYSAHSGSNGFMSALAFTCRTIFVSDALRSSRNLSSSRFAPGFVITAKICDQLPIRWKYLLETHFQFLSECLRIAHLRKEQGDADVRDDDG